MGMPPSFFVRPEISGMGPPVAHPMYMVAYLFNVVVGIEIEVLTSLAMIPGSLNHMKHMWNYTYGNKRMPEIIKINTPGVTRSFGKQLKFPGSGMIPPNPGIQLCALIIGCSGLTHV
jgi:hypothetical protein